MDEQTPVTLSDLRAGLVELGLKRRGIVMLHCRMSAIGWVVGGSETVVRAILEALGPAGTLVAVTGWEHDSYDLEKWPEPRRAAYLRDPPAFDPELSESARENGRLPERIRTWPGAHRSRHPEASFAALGLRAEWLTSEQPWDHPYGPGSPLAKLVEAGGDVLMLGAPLETVTLLHHAEELARAPTKRLVTYRAPMRGDDRVEWRTIHDIETSEGAFDYDTVVAREKDAFEVIAEEAVEAGIGVRGKVGRAESWLFPGRELVEFAVAWMEERFGTNAEGF